LTSKSASRHASDSQDDFVSAVERLRGQAAPAIAKALDLDRAEAVEAALNAVAELALAARELLRALPLPPESRTHIENAEREAVRAARLAVASLDKAARGRAGGAPLKRVRVAFGKGAAGKGAAGKGAAGKGAAGKGAPARRPGKR